MTNILQAFLLAPFVFIVSLLSVIVLTNYSIKFLNKRGMVVEDYHKPQRPKVPRPGGPAILTSILFSEALVFLFTGSFEVLAIMLVVAIAATVGLIDDLKTIGGVAKPLMLLAAGIPIVALQAYDYHLALPFFGSVRLSLIYPILILIAIPVASNTVNTIDVLNGVVSSFVAIASISLIFAFIFKGSYLMVAATMPLLASSIGFYLYHKYPSRIFPGDSGTLAWGAMYGALTIVGGVEVVGVVALLPAILNSFLFLSSVRRLVEHRALISRPIIVLEDGMLEASHDATAPITLVRMILAKGPASEREIANGILKLGGYAALLSILTAISILVVKL